MHESGVAIVLGAVFGLIIYYVRLTASHTISCQTSGYVIPFSESSFFYFVLPPIIFAAGYTLRRRNFIKNLPFIICLGLLGTFISMTVGIAFGFLSAFLTKKVVNFQEHPVREILLLLVLAYLSYMVTEILAFSGIMALFCCGFTMNHYTYYNLSRQSQSGSVLSIQTLSNVAEAFLFTYLGFSLISISSNNYSFSFLFILLVITLVARLLSVAVSFAVLWLCGYRVQLKTVVFVWYGGLIRGAIAYALTFRIDKSLSKQPQIIRQNTLMIVLISTLLFGSLMSVFAKILGISIEKESSNKKIFKRFRHQSVETLDEILLPQNQLSLEEPEQHQAHRPLRRIQSLHIGIPHNGDEDQVVNRSRPH